jgi:hypothetical protein
LLLTLPPLTPTPAPLSFVIVSRFRHNFLAVCVTALWLLATQHCGLEAAGFFSAHDEESSECCVGSGGCENDGCATVEEGAYRPDSSSLAISAPSHSGCLAVTIWHLAAPPRELPADMALRHGSERPLDWVATWQFVQRAARSPRAPSSLAA